MMNVTVTCPDRQHYQLMEEFLRRSKRGQRDGVNGRMLDIDIKAYQNTHIADRAAIEARLGVTAYAYKERYASKAKMRKVFKRGKAILDENFSLAYMIIQKRFRERTGLMLPKAVAVADALRMISAVLRSVGFMRSGWIPGLKKLNSVVKGGAKTVTTGLNDVRGRPKGYAYPATSDDNPTAEIGNTTKVASEVAGPALEMAIRQSQGWMEAKMREDAEKIARAMAGKTIG